MFPLLLLLLLYIPFHNNHSHHFFFFILQLFHVFSLHFLCNIIPCFFTYTYVRISGIFYFYYYTCTYVRIWPAQYTAVTACLRSTIRRESWQGKKMLIYSRDSCCIPKELLFFYFCILLFLFFHVYLRTTYLTWRVHKHDALRFRPA